MKIKLNGWQRLWVVLSIIYFVIVAGFSFALWPAESNIENSWAYSLIDKTKDPNDYAYQIRDAYKDISDKELIRRINAKYSSNQNYKEILNTINLKYQSELQSLWKEQFKAIAIALMAWLLPIAIVYLLGLSFGWIYKGFKNK
jgi:hypothetical protein